MKILFRIILTACLQFAGNGAIAQSDPAVLAERAAEQLQQAAQSLENARRARDRIAALTETIRAYENGLLALRDSMRQASIQEAAIRAVLTSREEQLVQLLGALQSIEHAPPQLLMLHPAGPIGTARSGMMLSDVTQGLQASAEALRADLQELNLLLTLQQDASMQLQEGLQGIQNARLALSQALSDRVDRPQRLAEDPEQMQALLDASETLQAFAIGLSDLPETELSVEAADFSEAKGQITLPAAGTLLRDFNAADAAGIQRPGWILAVRPLTIVTNPWAATVRYSGPLLDYGNVVILEPDQTHLIIIAGLETLYVSQGDVVEENNPLGLMGRPDGFNDAGLNDENLIDTGTERTETLYIEIRENRVPVDPALWFAHQEE